MDLNRDPVSENKPFEIKYRMNYVEVYATDKEEHKLRSKLLATGFMLPQDSEENAKISPNSEANTEIEF